MPTPREDRPQRAEETELHEPERRSDALRPEEEPLPAPFFGEDPGTLDEPDDWP